MKQKLKWSYLIAAILIMAFVEHTMTYWPKSIFKILLLFVIPYLTFKLKYSYKEIKIIKATRYLSLVVVFGIIIGYFILGNFIDYQQIKNQLGNSMSIIKSNFVWIALYISIVNAGIEEFFFRGMFYLEECDNRNTIISAAAFSLYHIAIMGTWISLPLLILSSLGLFVVGLVFNKLTLESKGIYNSYLVHMLANITLNTLAYFLFYSNFLMMNKRMTVMSAFIPTKIKIR